MAAGRVSAFPRPALYVGMTMAPSPPVHVHDLADELAAGRIDAAPSPVRPADRSRRSSASERRRRNLLLGLDATGLGTTWGLALGTAGATGPGGGAVRLATVGVAVALGLTVLARAGAYRVGVAEPGDQAARVARAVVIAGLPALLLAAAGGELGASPAWAAMVASGLLLTGQRAVVAAWLRASRIRGHHTRPIAIVGADDEARRLQDLIADHPEHGYVVAGIIADRARAARSGIPAPWLADYAGAAQAALEAGCAEVVVVVGAVPAARRPALLADLLAAGIRVRASPGLAGIGHGRVRPAPLAHELLLAVGSPAPPSHLQTILKRVFDIVASSLALVVTAPVLAAAALAVKIGDGGPVLFRQERVGQGGAPFTLVKLRTMDTDAPTRLAEVLSLNERREGPLFKAGHDPRVTAVGRLLRASSIDELPQLLNVLRGSMSLVGPRPALPAEVARFDEELARARLRVRPGLTGLWQVEARDNPSYRPYRRLDLFYVENWSWSLDLYVLAATVWVVTARGLGTALGLLGARRRAGSGSEGGAGRPGLRVS